MLILRFRQNMNNYLHLAKNYIKGNKKNEDDFKTIN